MPRRPGIPIDSSWRMVEGGENDSFDTSVVHDDEQDPFVSQISQASQISSAGPMSVGGSQDSIGDFVNRADDERVILRSPFQPSIPAARRTPRRVTETDHGQRSPDPEFIMPTVEVEGRSGRNTRDDGYNLRKRAPRQSDNQGSPPKRRVRRKYINDIGEEGTTFTERIAASIPNAIFGILSWFFGIITMALRYAQRPLAVLLAIYFSCGAFIMVQNMLTQSLFVSLSPLCRIPGASYLDLPFCPQITPVNDGEHTPQEIRDGGTGHVEFDDLMNVQAEFEEVLKRSADGVSLPLEMKRSERSIRDLRTMVRYSELSAREELAQEFDGYIDAARSSTLDLQRFNTHVGSAVDSIISVNRWMSRYLDSLDSGSSINDGLIWVWTDWVFAPFQPATKPESVFDEGALRDRYVEHTTLLSDRIAGLVLEANTILRDLDRAESHLSLIFEISTRSTQTVRSKREAIAHTFLSIFGANSRAINSLDSQLALLKHVGRQRDAAVAQLSALVVDLERIEANLADLRERVAEPEIASRGGSVVPIAVHVETIDRGVERLEDARSRLRAVETERIKEALAKGGVKEEKLLEFV